MNSGVIGTNCCHWLEGLLFGVISSSCCHWLEGLLLLLRFWVVPSCIQLLTCLVLGILIWMCFFFLCACLTKKVLYEAISLNLAMHFESWIQKVFIIEGFLLVQIYICTLVAFSFNPFITAVETSHFHSNLIGGTWKLLDLINAVIY